MVLLGLVSSVIDALTKQLTNFSFDLLLDILSEKVQLLDRRKQHSREGSGRQVLVAVVDEIKSHVMLYKIVYCLLGLPTPTPPPYHLDSHQYS